MKWQRYVDLEPVKRLKNEGREFLGERVCVTEKRDGQNISIWLQETNIDVGTGNIMKVKVSSHNLEEADDKLVSRFKSTPEYDKAVLLLNDEFNEYNNNLILYGELLLTTSPTRIEPRRKNIHWILFDIYDEDQNRFLGYNEIYQKAYHYKIPVVRLLHEFIPNMLSETESQVVTWLKWCRRHRREGSPAHARMPSRTDPRRQ